MKKGQGKRLDVMWDSLVRPFADEDEFEANRSLAALKQLQAIAALAQDDQSANDFKLESMSRALALWQLLAAENMVWLTDLYQQIFASNKDRDYNLMPQAHLLSLIDIAQSGISPLHRNAFDPCAPLIPAPLFKILSEAIHALGSGEVHPIFCPTHGGRHHAPWSWDQARLRAVEHVAFLAGKGQTKTSAQQRVGRAMRVGVETLRFWERQLKKGDGADSIKRAQEAGKLAALLEDDPTAWSSEKSVDAAIAFAMETMRGESIVDFGAKYHAEFGSRHNQ